MKVFTNFAFAAFMGLVILWQLTGCQKSKASGSAMGFNDIQEGTDSYGLDTSFLDNPTGGSPAGINNTLNRVGSGTNGQLTTSDQNALKQTFNGMDDVAPNGDLIPQELVDEVQKLLEDQSKGRDVSAQKMALAGAILESCARKVQPLQPIPGQHLMGVWGGSGKCPVEFEVSGQVNPGTNEFRITGGIQGSLVGAADGRGEVRSSFTGILNDMPKVGSGTLKNPNFSQGKYGPEACEVQVAMKESRNPIPENYIQAMRKVGLCHRQALFLLSPTMDQMFEGMDPRLASLMQAQLLGTGAVKK